MVLYCWILQKENDHEAIKPFFLSPYPVTLEKSLTGNYLEAYELFDLENDLGEQHNLISDQKAVAEDLAEKLKTWRENVGAQMPVFRKQ